MSLQNRVSATAHMLCYCCLKDTSTVCATDAHTRTHRNTHPLVLHS